MNQQPNPALKNTAIYVGNDEELRKKAIEYYESNGYPFDLSLNDPNDCYIGSNTDNNGSGSYSHYAVTSHKDKIITLPTETEQGVIQSLQNDYFKDKGEELHCIYTKNINEAKTFTSMDEFIKYTERPLWKANPNYFKFIPLSEITETETKYPCEMLVSDDGIDWVERLVIGEYKDRFIAEVESSVDRFHAWNFAKPVPTTTVTVDELVAFYEKSNNVKVEVK